MTPGGEAPTASSPDPVRALGQQLEQSGYLETSLPEALASDGPLATLAALFGLGVGGAAPRRCRTPPRSRRRDCSRARANDVRARLRISVWNGLLMAHDGGGGPRPDVVMEPRESAQTLAHLTVRRPGQTVLDLGCGCGPHALLAARHGERVVATDINPRAAAADAAERPAQRRGRRRRDAARRPLRARGRRALRARAVEPALRHLARRDLLFRDSGLAPGELCRRIVAGAGEHLEEGGVASVLCSWGSSAGERPVGPAARVGGGHRLRRLRRQLGPGGRRPLRDALDRAVGGRGWGRGRRRRRSRAGSASTPRRASRRSGSGRSCSAGARAADNWFVGLDASRPPRRPGGAQLERIFAAQDWLAGRPDDALLDHALVPAAPHRLTHALEWRGAGYELAGIRLTLEDDIGVDAAVDPSAVPVLLALDGRPLREIVAAVAAAHGLEEAWLAQESLPCLRQLYGRGFLFLSS